MKRQSQKPKTYLLPWPPSLNHYWGNRVAEKDGKTYVHTYRTKRANEYREAVAVAVFTQGPVIFDGQLVVTLEIARPDNLRRDLDNLPKGILDSLTAAQVWGDDSQIYGLLIAWVPNKADGEVRVTIQPWKRTLVARIVESFKRWWYEPSGELEQMDMF